MIEWNGINSDSMNVIVEYIPRRTITKKKINVYSVPGRNGDIIEDERAFENYIQQYDIFIEGDDISNLPLRSRAISDWLMEPDGYSVLRDSYDINSFRKAYFQGPMDIESWFNIHGKATLEFVCDPRRYLDEGQKPNIIQQSTTYLETSIYNPTSFSAKPLIEVNSLTSDLENISISINDKTIQILQLNRGMVIDCETCQAYSEGSFKNNDIFCNDFPVFNKGHNTIITSIPQSSDVTFTIIPRWWTL